MSPRLSYADGLLRLAQALGHLGALREIVPYYHHAAARQPARFETAPTPDAVTVALATLQQALAAMTIEDFFETLPHGSEARSL